MQLSSSKKDVLYFLLFTALLCVAVFFHSDALAQYNDTILEQGQLSQGTLFCPERYDGITGRVVNCIRSVLIHATANFLDAFLPYYEAALMATLVLSMTLYGALFLAGTISRPTGSTFIFLFKLAAVGYFAVQFGGWITHLFNFWDGLLNIVVNYVRDSTFSACSEGGEYLTQVFHLDRPNLDVWDKIDCLFLTLLGISISTAGPVAVGSGIIAILGALFFTGGIGLIIFVVAIYFILTLMFAVMRAVKIYLTSVMVVCFLICISPLMIPLLLFSHTQPLFDKWVKYLANYMLVPIFLFAYLSMVVAAYDAVLFRGTSSLFYAIAGPASQTEGFSFRDWLDKGVDGEGNEVGAGIPGMHAQIIQGYITGCASGDEETLEQLGDVCDQSDAFPDMLECALTPMLPGEDEEEVYYDKDGGSGAGDTECGVENGVPYHGFLRNEEIMHWGIAPGVKTDKDGRKKGCGRFDFICKGKKAVGNVFNAVKNFVGDVVGAVWRIGGILYQGIGLVLKGVGSFIDEGCRFVKIPGAVCTVATGPLIVTGSVVHAAGTVANFAGRVMMNGLMNELGEMFNNWFDVATLDLHKIAAYKCQVLVGYADTEEYLAISSGDDATCDDERHLIIEVLYVMAAAAVLAYLMLNWLNYIPTLGKVLVGTARVEANLPGEAKFKSGAQKVEHGLEKLKSKASSKMVAKRGGV